MKFYNAQSRVKFCFIKFKIPSCKLPFYIDAAKIQLLSFSMLRNKVEVVFPGVLLSSTIASVRKRNGKSRSPLKSLYPSQVCCVLFFENEYLTFDLDIADDLLIY